MKRITSTGYMTSGQYKGVPMKNVPYWSQPGKIHKAKDYVSPNAKPGQPKTKKGIPSGRSAAPSKSAPYNPKGKYA